MVLSSFLKRFALSSCGIPFQFFLEHCVQLQGTQIQHPPPPLHHQRKYVHCFPTLYSLVTQIPRVFLHALEQCLSRLCCTCHEQKINRMSGDSLTLEQFLFSSYEIISYRYTRHVQYLHYFISDCDKLTKKTSFLQKQKITRTKKKIKWNKI